MSISYSSWWFTLLGFSSKSNNAWSLKSTFSTFCGYPYLFVFNLSIMEFYCSPKLTPLTHKHLNFMILQVRVPVLSERIWLTYPSSSLSPEHCTFVGLPVIGDLVLGSYAMMIPCINLTISSVTSKEIGTKFVKISIHVPHFTKKL